MRESLSAKIMEVTVEKPAPPFTGEQVFEYIPDWMGGQDHPNGKEIRLACQLLYFALVLLVLYLVSRWHDKHFAAKQASNKWKKSMIGIKFEFTLTQKNSIRKLIKSSGFDVFLH